MNMRRLAVGFVVAGSLMSEVPTAGATPLPPDIRFTATAILAIDFTGRTVVVGDTFDGSGLNYRIDRLTGAATQLPPLLSASADGSAIVTRDGNWKDVDSGNTVSVPVRADAARYLLTGDGSTYALGGAIDTKLWVVDALTGTHVDAPVNGKLEALSANGRFVLIDTACDAPPPFGDPRCDVSMWDRSTGNVTAIVRRALHESLTAGVADTGRVIVTTDAAPPTAAVIRVRDLNGQRRVLFNYRNGVGGGQLSTDGRVFSFGVTPTSCCSVYGAMVVDSGLGAGSRESGGASLPPPHSIHLSGDGSRFVYINIVSFGPPTDPTIEALALQNVTPAPRVAAGEVLPVTVAGVNGVPPDASSAMVNVTVTNPSAAGFVAFRRCGQPQPSTSNLNFVAGQTVANAVLADIGSDGKICVSSNASVDLIVDVQGWFPASSPYSSLGNAARVADTRNGEIDGIPNLPALQTLPVEIAGGHGIPPDASSVMLNVTVTSPTTAGHLTVWPCDQPQPDTSNLNFIAGQTIANAVLATVDGDGKVCAVSDAAVDLIVDAQGWFGAGSPYTALVPDRILDTRQGTAPSVVAGTVVEVSAPAGATSVMLNVTATRPAAPGFLAAWPCGQPQPSTSTLNFAAGQTVANAALVGVGDGGKVCLASNATTDILVDLQGTFGAGSPYHPIAPARALDSRI